MSSRTSVILLWLFVINLGTAFGAGLYEHRIVLPRWVSPPPSAQWNPEAAQTDDTGVRFWVFVTTVPLTLLTVANVYAGWRAPQPARSWWRGAALVALVERAFTFAYFIPTMVRLTNTPDSPQAAAAALQWSNLNYLCHALVLVALLTALKAFSVVYASRQVETRLERGAA